MTPGEPGGGERRATPERGEKFSASPRLKEHIIQGVFEGPTGPRVATAKEVSKNSFDALNAHHYDLRKKDNQRVREQIKANLRPEQRSMLAAKIKEDHPNYTQDQIKAQVEYQHHLGEWAIAERVRLSQVAIAAKESDQVQVLGEAMQALGLPTDPNALILSFYNTGSFEGGTFYKKFCTGDVNRNFAEKLTVEQMFVLKPFLKDLLGDTHIERTTGQTSDVAFNALVALRESMDALKNPQALIQAGESNTALSLADTAVLKFYQEGLQLAQPNEPKQTQGVHSPNNQDELNNRNQETAQPEKVRTAKQEIFEKAGKRSLEEAQTLFTEMTKVLEEEQKVGQGKFRETIAETKAALEADPKAKEVLKRSGIVRDGATVYVPDDGGIMIDFGDVHGDFDVVKRIIETEQFIENQENGDGKMKLVFYGDLVDRGAKSIELMEMLAALKTRYPEKIVIIGADHDVIVAPGLSPHDFPDKLITRYGLLKGFHISILETNVQGSQFEDNIFAGAKEILPESDIRRLNKTDLAKAVVRVLHLETGENPQAVDYNAIATEFNLPPRVLSQVVKLEELISLAKGSKDGAQTFLSVYGKMFRALPKERICGVLDTTHGGPPPEIMGINKFAELASVDAMQAHAMYEAATWGDPIPELPDHWKQLQDVYTKLQTIYDSNITAGEQLDPEKRIQVQDIFTGQEAKWNTTWTLGNVVSTMKKISLLFPTLDTGEPDFSQTHGITVNVGRSDGTIITALFNDHYFYNQAYLEGYLKRRGAKIYTRGHQTTDGLENGITQIAFGGQLITIHTTGMMGSERHPTYLVIDTSKTDQIGPANIKQSPRTI